MAAEGKGKKNGSRAKQPRDSNFPDRNTIWLVAVALSVGLATGFFFGRHSTFGTQPSFGPAVPVRKSKLKLPSPKKPAVPQAAIVIDDIGYNTQLAELVWQLPQPVTLGILPQLTYSTYFAKEGKKHGFEVILHQPMEPLRNSEGNDPGMIWARMKDEEITKTLEANLKTVPNAAGVSNHRGSYATQDRRVMRAILSTLKKKRLFFMDSLTTPLSVAGQEADKMQIRILKRTIFLDNHDDPDYIRGQLHKLWKLARKKGNAVGIGHYRASTLLILREMIPESEKEGIQIVPLKKMLSG